MTTRGATGETDMGEVHAPPALEAHSIVKTFGPVVAVDRASIELRSGQITALVGNNGAGKSTLAKILCGAIAPDEGAIAVDGQQVKFRDPGHARQLGISDGVSGSRPGRTARRRP